MNSSQAELDLSLRQLARMTDTSQELLDRFSAEVAFARELCVAHPAQQTAWESLVVSAIQHVTVQLAQGTRIEEAVHEAEALLAPLGVAAKTYTLHCVGHAHLDMNWMWNWPETVAAVNDTYTTIDRLMDEFPTFTFAQSQTSIYQIMKDYTPRLYEKVKQRIREGRWEVVANQWVESDKNMTSGESICRQLLYTKRFFADELDMPADAITIDWEPDTFGHAQTIPTILGQGGVRRYYFCRTGTGPQLFWWQGTDGTRLLAFDDNKRWYINKLNPEVTRDLFAFERATGLRDYLFVYGVGDHGGGPTRQDLRMGLRMNEWPIFPRIMFSTTRAFFDIVEAAKPTLPVVDCEMNTIFEGCYTSQSAVKHANRRSEHLVVEAEMVALLGTAELNLPYPHPELYDVWRRTLLNQFHDILPGSGAHATIEYALGLYQEILARTSMIKTEALRGIAARVNTLAICPCHPVLPVGVRDGQGLGAGMGDVRHDGAVTRYGTGSLCSDPFVIFNPSPWPRTEVVTVRLWNRDYGSLPLEVRDDAGHVVPAQAIGSGAFWWLHHEYQEVAFPVTEVPAFGYRTYTVARATAPTSPTPDCTARLDGLSKQGAEINCMSFAGITTGVLENEYYRVVIEQESGAILHLLDKNTGIDLVPDGERLGVLEYVHEAPVGMSAWHIGQILDRHLFTSGAKIACPHSGPYLGVIRITHAYKSSTFTLDISLSAGVPRVDFTLTVDWLERGSPTLGIPALKIVFPLALEETVATFECPNGAVTRPTDGREVPAQRWVDLSGTQQAVAVGATLVNEAKYGFSVLDHTLRMSLLRSSYDPDPLPELGPHTIKFALLPHVGCWTPSAATRAGAAFNLPLNIIGTDEHEGDLPLTHSYAELLTANVMLSALKRAEDSDALIIRLYEMEGMATIARVKLDTALVAPNATAVQTDLLEHPLPVNTAKLIDGVLTVAVPAYGMATVQIG